jgi:hypothetical protein
LLIDLKTTTRCSHYFDWSGSFNETSSIAIDLTFYFVLLKL